jgi:hypothetical protein
LDIIRERPSAAEANRYRQNRNQQALYTAAAQLWKHGVEMSKAIKIVSDAVKASSSS